MAPRLDNATGNLTGDQFLKLYREMRASKRAVDTAVGEHRNVLKRMKSDGIDNFALGLLEKLVKVEEEQASLHLRNLVTYATWTGANVGLKQGDLFVGADMPQPTAEATEAFVESVAEDNGYATGRARDNASNNPHAPGSAAHVAWMRGWNRGQAEEVTATFGRPAKAPTPPKQPTRRGRNPAASTRSGDVLGETLAKLDDPDPVDPAAEAAIDEAARMREEAAADHGEDAAEPDKADGNVFPLHARRPTAKAKVATPKARAKSDKAAKAAADRLAGTPVIGGEVAF